MSNFLLTVIAKYLQLLLKKLKIFEIRSHYLKREEAKHVLDFLGSAESSYCKLHLSFEDDEDVIETLNVIKSKHPVIHATIMSKEIVSKDAEELAKNMLDTNFWSSLCLNSKMKTLRLIKQEGIKKCFK